MLGEKLVALRKKYGYSQQDLAERLNVTRQTISNWECGQGAPALDKAAEIAKIYQVSLDDLVGDGVQFVIKEKSKPDQRILKCLVGKYVRISYSDTDLFLEMDAGFGSKGKVKVLEVTEDWIRVEYIRTKENTLLKKETVIKLIDVNAVDGFVIEEEGQ